MIIDPKTPSEGLLFTTVRLETITGSGTGFFFHFEINGEFYPVIVTNKHVVNNKRKEKIKFNLHENTTNGIGGNIEAEFDTDWLFHPDENIDLCCCFIQPLINQVKISSGKDIFYMPIELYLIHDDLKLKELSAIEDTIMVGYPNGLWDTKNNLPLFRKGITASHPSVDFNRDGVGVVDMACFPGSSGSPIFILNEGTYSLKSGGIAMGNRLIFLGILFQGPQINSKGELILEDIPTSQKLASHTPMMINLGYYIKAAKILDLKQVIEKYIVSVNKP